MYKPQRQALDSQKSRHYRPNLLNLPQPHWKIQHKQAIILIRVWNNKSSYRSTFRDGCPKYMMEALTNCKFNFILQILYQFRDQSSNFFRSLRPIKSFKIEKITTMYITFAQTFSTPMLFLQLENACRKKLKVLRNVNVLYVQKW